MTASGVTSLGGTPEGVIRALRIMGERALGLTRITATSINGKQLSFSSDGVFTGEYPTGIRRHASLQDIEAMQAEIAQGNVEVTGIHRISNRQIQLHAATRRPLNPEGSTAQSSRGYWESRSAQGRPCRRQ